MLYTIILFAILFYLIYSIVKKVTEVESFGKNYSMQFTIDASDALENIEFFRKATEIKSYIEKKPFNKWTNLENELFRKKWVDVLNDSSIILTYLASDDAFLIRHHKNGTYIVRWTPLSTQ